LYFSCGGPVLRTCAANTKKRGPAPAKIDLND
jgi:hypothetical protein